MRKFQKIGWNAESFDLYLVFAKLALMTGAAEFLRNEAIMIA